MCFRLIRKKALLPLVIKKATNKILKITAQLLYFLSAESFLKDSCLLKCLVFCLANNVLAPPNKSGFKPGDPCINQFLSITHEIYPSFDYGFLKLEEFSWIYLKFSIKFGMKELYLTLSKTLFPMTCSNILSDVLRNRMQRVTLNGQTSSRTNVSQEFPKDIS